MSTDQLQWIAITAVTVASMFNTLAIRNLGKAIMNILRMTK